MRGGCGQILCPPLSARTRKGTVPSKTATVLGLITNAGDSSDHVGSIMRFRPCQRGKGKKGGNRGRVGLSLGRKTGTIEKCIATFWAMDMPFQGSQRLGKKGDRNGNVVKKMAWWVLRKRELGGTSSNGKRGAGNFGWGETSGWKRKNGLASRAERGGL